MKQSVPNKQTMKNKKLIFFCLIFLLQIEINLAFELSNSFPELDYINESVNPCDNFYEFTCGNFKNVHPLPEKASNIDHFTILQEEIHKKAKRILSSDRKDEDAVALQKAKAFYAGCIRLEYANKQTYPFKQILESFGGWPVISSTAMQKSNKKISWTEIGTAIADYGIPFFFELVVTSSYLDPTANVIMLTKDRLSNPDAGIYAHTPDDFDYFADLNNLQQQKSLDSSPLVPYETFLFKTALKMKKLTGSFKNNSTIISEIKETFKYLRFISAGGILDANVNFTTLPSELTIRQLQEWTDTYFGSNLEMNWLEFLNAVSKNAAVQLTEDVRIIQTSTPLIFGILNLYKLSSGDMVKNYIIARILTHIAPDTDAEMRLYLKDFYDTFNYPVYERSEYCVRKILGYPGYVDFSLAVTHEYLHIYFNHENLQEASLMVKDLHNSFLEILENSNWMDIQSKDKAKKKLDKMITLLGYPDFVEDMEKVDSFYQNIRVCTWDHFGNSQRLRAFRLALNMREIINKKNRELWNLSPLEVNAFYNRANNRILFPVSVLNPIFFNSNLSLINYARIGAVIGHEITHGFDNEGRKFSENGTVTNWWSTETQNAFNNRTLCFENQYDKYFIQEIGMFVNGTQTLNENLADNGGLRSALKATNHLLSRSYKKQKLKEYTQEQLFFIGFGSMWCMTETPEYLNKMHKSQNYSPGRYRVNGAVSNMQEFAEAFKCPKGSPMNPSNKCVLW